MRGNALERGRWSGGPPPFAVLHNLETGGCNYAGLGLAWDATGAPRNVADTDVSPHRARGDDLVLAAVAGITRSALTARSSEFRLRKRDRSLVRRGYGGLKLPFNPLATLILCTQHTLSFARLRALWDPAYRRRSASACIATLLLVSFPITSMSRRLEPLKLCCHLFAAAAPMIAKTEAVRAADRRLFDPSTSLKVLNSFAGQAAENAIRSGLGNGLRRRPGPV